VVDDHVAAIERLPITPNTFIVIATRGHKEDDAARARRSLARRLRWGWSAASAKAS